MAELDVLNTGFASSRRQVAGSDTLHRAVTGIEQSSG
jgi:hypothetical protein